MFDKVKANHVVFLRWVQPMTPEEAAEYTSYRKRDRIYAVVSESTRRRRDGTFNYVIDYIGQTTRTPGVRLFDQNHKLWKIIEDNGRGWNTWVTFAEVRRLAGNVTTRFVNEVESGLIFNLEPEWNERNRMSYRSRDYIIVNVTRSGIKAALYLPPLMSI